MSKPWCTVGPIYESYQDENNVLGVPFDMGHGVTIGPLPAWVCEEDITKHLSSAQKRHLEGDPALALAVKYEAESLGDPDPDWRGEGVRSKQDSARDLLIHANLALWLARPSCIGFPLMIHAFSEEDRWYYSQIHTMIRLIPYASDANMILTTDDFSKAKGVFGQLALVPREGSVWIAVRTLWKALCEPMWEVRFLSLWIALESLFGPSNPGEITFRLSQRIAFFLGQSTEERKDIFKRTKNGYKWRSKVVHGMRFSRNERETEESSTVMKDSEDLVRRVLCKVVGDRNIFDKLNGREREKYLDDAVFA